MHSYCIYALCSLHLFYPSSEKQLPHFPLSKPLNQLKHTLCRSSEATISCSWRLFTFSWEFAKPSVGLASHICLGKCDPLRHPLRAVFLPHCAGCTSTKNRWLFLQGVWKCLSSPHRSNTDFRPPDASDFACHYAATMPLHLLPKKQAVSFTRSSRQGLPFSCRPFA